MIDEPFSLVIAAVAAVTLHAASPRLLRSLARREYSEDMSTVEQPPRSGFFKRLLGRSLPESASSEASPPPRPEQKAEQRPETAQELIENIKMLQESRIVINGAKAFALLEEDIGEYKKWLKKESAVAYNHTVSLNKLPDQFQAEGKTVAQFIDTVEQAEIAHIRSRDPQGFKKADPQTWSQAKEAYPGHTNPEYIKRKLDERWESARYSGEADPDKLRRLFDLEKQDFLKEFDGADRGWGLKNHQVVQPPQNPAQLFQAVTAIRERDASKKWYSYDENKRARFLQGFAIGALEAGQQDLGEKALAYTTEEMKQPIPEYLTKTISNRLEKKIS